ncbi:MAG: cytochrome c biosis protein [Clostridia bacterium]|nr:cytochrome c biosis protein [Clostridia bacterium]
MKLGLFLLLILGVSASLGSLIPQGQSGAFYKMYYGRLLGSLIVFLSLDNLFRSWWFIALGIILAASILSCSVQRIRKLPGRKGWGSILLHLSILVVLAGAVVSGVFGRSAYVEVGVGDSIDLTGKGFPGQVLTLKDFNIAYYPNLEPKQYYSKVALKTNDGREIEREISVNHPLKFKGLKIYQTSYGWMTRGRVIADGEAIPFDLESGGELAIDQNSNLRLKLIFVPDFDEKTGTLRSKSPLPRNPRLACALIQGHNLIEGKILREGETGEIKGYRITFSGYRYYTGLTVKKDPGVTIVYLGFALILLGLAVRYLAPDKKRLRDEVN